MNGWRIKLTGEKQKITKPVLVVGLPGIGNVGKVAVDFIVEELKAKRIYDFFSYSFPHSVFVNEQNLIELPKIEMYHKEVAGRSVLLLAGDVQPIDEASCYSFCEKVLDIFQSLKGNEIVTLGGIGLQSAPKKPRIYCTGNSKELIERWCKNVEVEEKLHGVVGPIVGVAGVLLGLAGKRGISAVSLLAETYGHPMYLGIKGARELLQVLNKKLGLNVKLEDMDKEIKEIESDMLKKTEELGGVAKQTALKKIAGKLGKEVSYIG